MDNLCAMSMSLFSVTKMRMVYFFMVNARLRRAHKENARTRRAGQRPHRNGERPPNTSLNPQIQTSQEYLWSRCGKTRFVFDWSRHFG